MSTRIRYIETSDKDLKRSSKNFLITHNGAPKNVYMLLNTETYLFQVRDVNSGDLIASGGNTGNMTVLLRQAKRCLEELGVLFGPDNRKRE